MAGGSRHRTPARPDAGDACAGQRAGRAPASSAPVVEGNSRSRHGGAWRRGRVPAPLRGPCRQRTAGRDRRRGAGLPRAPGASPWMGGWGVGALWRVRDGRRWRRRTHVARGRWGARGISLPRQGRGSVRRFAGGKAGAGGVALGRFVACGRRLWPPYRQDGRWRGPPKAGQRMHEAVPQLCVAAVRCCRLDGATAGRRGCGGLSQRAACSRRLGAGPRLDLTLTTTEYPGCDGGDGWGRAPGWRRGVSLPVPSAIIKDEA